MSRGSRCTCGARDGWVVTRRNFRESAFDGYRRVSSDYSDVRCSTCGAYWRTNAGYVDGLPDDPEEARRSERDKRRTVGRGGQYPLSVAYAPRRGRSVCGRCGKAGGPLLGPLTLRDGELVHRDGCGPGGQELGVRRIGTS